MAFRRSFFLPFDDDPEALFQLCFEASLLYAPDRAFESWSRWFQVDVEKDHELAVDAFIRHVENSMTCGSSSQSVSLSLSTSFNSIDRWRWMSTPSSNTAIIFARAFASI
jgi:hypothetical protein